MTSMITKTDLESLYMAGGLEAVKTLTPDRLEAEARTHRNQLIALETDLAQMSRHIPEAPTVSPQQIKGPPPGRAKLIVFPLLLAAAAAVVLTILPTHKKERIPTEVPLRTGAGVNYPVPAEALSPLQRAAWEGNPEQAIAALANEADRPTQFEWTALSLAAGQGHRDIAAMLLARDVRWLDHPNKDGETPLMLAAKYGHESTVRLLLERQAEVDAVNREGYTALDLARLARFQNIVDLLEAQ